MSIHKGHRERLKKRMLNEGLDGFEDVNALELLLFFSIPQADTNPLAHRLLDSFGSLAAVLETDYENLLKVEGVGANTATLISMIPQISRKYLVSKSSATTILNSTEKAGNFLLPRFIGLKNEVVMLICLDAKCKVLGLESLFEGSINSAQIYLPKIVQTAYKYNAYGVIMAHNHVSGIALPSEEDERTTLEVFRALEVLNIRLLDHIIVADDDFVSLKDNGFFSKY